MTTAASYFRWIKSPRWPRALPGISTKGTHHVFELIMILSVVLVAWVYYVAAEARSYVLHLYFLPVIVSGFYLGRYASCILALLSFVLVQIVGVTTGPLTMTAGVSVSWIGILVWGAVLGLVALLVGTLCEQRTRALKELEELHRADTLNDALTSIPNRRAFDHELARRCAEWNRGGTPVALVMVDVDLFKTFNDRYGHLAGDAVLKDVAKVLQNSIREYDLAARYGGEEFAVILPNTKLNEAKRTGERIRQAVNGHWFTYEGARFRLTVSVGVSEVLPNDDTKTLVDRADEALYASKQSGRNCVHFHDGTDCHPCGSALPATRQQPEQLARNPIMADGYTDSSTGLPHQKIFNEELRRRVAEAHRYHAALSVLYVRVELPLDAERSRDADDRILAVVAECLQSSLRDPDLATYHDDLEFAVLLPATELAAARVAAQRLAELVAGGKKPAYQGRKLRFTVRIGAAQLQSGESAAELLERSRSAQSGCDSAQSELLHSQ